MPNPNGDAPKYPKYCRHKRKNGCDLAYVTLSGRQVYLGTHGTKASHEAYDRAIREWLQHGRTLPVPPSELTVNRLLVAYLSWAREYYAGSDEYQALTQAVRPLRQLYGRTPAAEFGPLRLKAVRDRMKELGWCRTNINHQISRVKRVFSWGVENEMVSPERYHALTAVKGIRRGREGTREGKPVRSVPDAHVDAVLPLLPPAVAAMVRLQRLTGMRPGEAVIMRTKDIDRSDDVWVYTPESHKTAHHGHSRTIRLGPKAQNVLKPFLKADPGACLFSPAVSERERVTARSSARKTPRWPSHMKRNSSKRTSKRKRPPRDRYDVHSYRRAIHRACDRLNDEAKKEGKPPVVDRWRPNQLRHTLATEVRKRYGLDAARAILGHRSADVTEIYAERDEQQADNVMREIG